MKKQIEKLINGDKIMNKGFSDYEDRIPVTLVNIEDDYYSPDDYEYSSYSQESFGYDIIKEEN